MKPVALHVPLSDRQRKSIERAAKDNGCTKGQEARRLMYGKLSMLEIVKRADLSDGTVLKIKTPEMKHPMTVRNGSFAAKYRGKYGKTASK